MTNSGGSTPYIGQVQGGTTTIGFSIGFTSPPREKCKKCGGFDELIRARNEIVCLPCARPEILNETLSGLMLATPPALRGNLYKKLAAVYHPDAGCAEPVFMEILNRVKDRYS